MSYEPTIVLATQYYCDAD